LSGSGAARKALAEPQFGKVEPVKDRDLKLLLLLTLLMEGRDGKDRADGVFSRVASLATGVVVDAVDPDVIIDRVDVNAIVERVDVDALIDRVDIDAMLDRIDVDALLTRVDVNQLLERVDVNALIDRVDVDRLMSRVDIDAIIDQVDVKEIADRAGIPEIVRESTGELAGSAMDVFRRQIVAVDQIVGGTLYRLIRRDPKQRPAAPPDLEAGEGVGHRGRGQVSGHYAGPISRLLAFAVDALFVWLVFVMIAAGISFVAGLFVTIDSSAGYGIMGLLVLVTWAFIYMWLSLAVAGRTFGMALIGLRVVNRQGEPLTGRQALIRTLVFPFSFLFFGIGFIGIFTSPERRTLHDSAAGSVMVYDWGDRPAEMPAPLTKWVARHASDNPDDVAAEPEPD
jgi:uncharacterized RDD family membrane protein YckC